MLPSFSGLEASPFSHDLGRCSRCGGLLDRYNFATDSLGRTLENCEHCGPMLLVLHVGAPRFREKAKALPQVIGKCPDCPNMMVWAGTGGIPERCKACQHERSRVKNLKRNRDNKARIKLLMKGGML